MPRNIEIKAKVHDIDSVVRTAASFADDGPIEIAQDDTFFPCPDGRLKLRQLSPDRGELIFYRRANQAGPKESFYVRTTTQDPQGLRNALNLAYGSAGRVIKHRTLFLAGRTRIHIDCVEGLGTFVELEVALADEDSVEGGTQEAAQIMEHLGIAPSQLIETAYVDLLNALQV